MGRVKGCRRLNWDWQLERIQGDSLTDGLDSDSEVNDVLATELLMSGIDPSKLERDGAEDENKDGDCLLRVRQREDQPVSI